MNTSYRDTMDRLRFTREQKEDMVENLLAAPAGRTVRPLRFRRFAAAGVAAALVLSLGVAGAAGGLDSAANAFAGLFGGAHTEVIDQIGYPIGASATADGITITADAILGDRYSYAVVYSIQREDGAPLADWETPTGGGADGDGLPLTFETSELTPDSLLPVLRWGGGGGWSGFFDADPADPAVQFVQMWTSDTPIRPGRVTATFQGLRAVSADYEDQLLLAVGPWELEFHMAFEDSSVVLPAGQEFSLHGMDARLNSVTISPLSIQVDYTVYEKAPEGAAEPFADFGDLPVVVTYTDGSALEIDSANTSVSSAGGHTHCMKGLVFETIRPLSEVASVTVGGVTSSVHVPDEKE